MICLSFLAVTPVSASAQVGRHREDDLLRSIRRFLLPRPQLRIRWTSAPRRRLDGDRSLRTIH